MSPQLQRAIRWPRILITGMIAALTVLAPVMVATPAQAATSNGYIRLTHLSPDTKQVDVTIISLSGATGTKHLNNVGYGAVSPYYSLPVGSYAIAMRPAGASPSSKPVLQGTVPIKSNVAETFAVFGRNASLKTKLITDDLSQPSAGQGRVRIIQASTSSTPVTVTTSDGTTLLDNASNGTASNYTDVKAGIWNLTATQGSKKTNTSVTVKAGQIWTVFVLDNASGGLDLKPVLDSASVGNAPTGFLATGGGYLAHMEQQREQEIAVGATALGLLALASLTLLVARRKVARA